MRSETLGGKGRRRTLLTDHIKHFLFYIQKLDDNFSLKISEIQSFKGLCFCVLRKRVAEHFESLLFFLCVLACNTDPQGGKFEAFCPRSRGLGVGGVGERGKG